MSVISIQRARRIVDACGGTYTSAETESRFGEGHTTALKDADAALAKEAAQPFSLAPYDAGLLNDFGGGDVSWWQDYLRAELGRAHDHYQAQIDALQSEAAR